MCRVRPVNSTRVLFLLLDSLDPSAMSETILPIYEYVRDLNGSRGDGLLPAEEDPFIYNKGRGAYTEVSW